MEGLGHFDTGAGLDFEAPLLSGVALFRFKTRHESLNPLNPKPETGLITQACLELSPARFPSAYP